jgi:hypothetical protein
VNPVADRQPRVNTLLKRKYNGARQPATCDQHNHALISSIEISDKGQKYRHQVNGAGTDAEDKALKRQPMVKFAVSSCIKIDNRWFARNVRLINQTCSPGSTPAAATRPDVQLRYCGVSLSPYFQCGQRQRDQQEGRQTSNGLRLHGPFSARATPAAVTEMMPGAGINQEQPVP